MGVMIRIAAVAILAAVLCVMVRQEEKAVAMGLSALSCAVVLVLGFRFLQPIWTLLKELEALSGLGGGVMKPLFKVVGIGLLTQIAGSICSEAGEVSLAKAVEISGTVLAVYASLPLLASVLSLVEKLIGGSV